MDTNGYIIASTNPKRLNQFHEASKKCVETKKTIIIEYDGQYIGAKKGINIPVNLNSEVIGVIGISGDIQEVGKYGTIIKKMTELLITEEWIKNNQFQKRENTRIYLESLINNKLAPHYYDIKDKQNHYYLAIYRIDNTYIDPNLTNSILDRIELEIHHNKIQYAIIYQELIIIFNHLPRKSVEKSLNQIIQIISDKTRFKPNFGVSSNFCDLQEANFYYKQAVSAFLWNRDFKSDENISFYEDMDLGILLTDIDESKRLNFSNKVLKDIRSEEFHFYKNLLNIYGNSNGSIQKTADALFMHKNTIQYRLDKLYQLTGYNPRILNDYIILKLAFLLN